MKLTLTKIYRSKTDKAGNPLKTKDGRPYTRVGIKTKEYSERWLSGFENSQNQYWEENDTVEVEVEEVAGRDGNSYLNFKMPNRLDVLETRVGKLEIEVKALLARSRGE